MMIKILIAAALVAGAVSSVDARQEGGGRRAAHGQAHALSWTKSDGMCAGGYENCASTAECTYTGLGPCSANETAPKWHLATTFVSLAFVADGYTTDMANKATLVYPKPGAQGLRKAEAGKTDAGQDDKTDGTEYAYAMAANMFGGDDTAYGYAGFASYLNTGTKDISINQNTFYGFSDYNTDFSTPKAYSICTSPMKGTECGAKRTFKPGAYKFSLFGTNLGANWKTAIAGMGKRTRMGFRMKLQAKGIAFDKVTLNGGTDITKIGETDVTSIVIANADTELKYTFPKDFNYGVASTFDELGDKGLKTGAIKVVVSMEGADALNIDYLFPMDKIGTDGDQYFVYDPEVTGGKVSRETTTTKAASSMPQDTETTTTKAASSVSQDTEMTTTIAKAAIPNGAGQLAASGFVAVVVAAVSQLF